MKKFTKILSLVAIVASTLLMSCAKKHQPDPVPAFPELMKATYALNSKGVHAWGSFSRSWSKTYYWTGFRVDPSDATRVMCYINPNKDWSATIVGEARDYLKFRVHKGGAVYNDNNYTLTNTVSGTYGNQPITLVVTKIPEFGEEAFVGNIDITMAEQTMPLAVITIGPLAE
jgi:hypothetical protein